MCRIKIYIFTKGNHIKVLFNVLIEIKLCWIKIVIIVIVSCEANK